MESSEAGAVDESQSLVASVEDAVTSKYEECNSEILSSQSEEDQGGEQIYGYLEVHGSGNEDATIIVDSQGFNLNGQSLILTHNDDGNGIIVLVSGEGGELEETFAHASALHTNEVEFEDELKEHEALIVDEQSQGLEFIESEEVSQEQEERQIYIESSGEILNISTENEVSAADVDSPLWSVSDGGPLKNDTTEMLFIPNPTVVLAPEETKHRKLMQLACIAHELQSVDQKNNTTVIECAKDTESSLSGFEEVTHNSHEKNPGITFKLSLGGETSEDFLNLSSKPMNVVSSLVTCTPVQTVDNTVSVIHPISTDVQHTSLENESKSKMSSDVLLDKNSQSSDIELQPENLYSKVSDMTYHDSLEDDSSAVQLEGCPKNGLQEEYGELSIPDVDSQTKDDSKGDLVPEDDDDDGHSPMGFMEKPENMDVGSPATEHNPLVNEADMQRDDDDSLAGSAILVVEEEESKEHGNDSNISFSDGQLATEFDSGYRAFPKEDVVMTDSKDKLCVSDNEISNNEQCVSTADVKLPLFTSKYSILSSKSKSKKNALEEKSLSPNFQDDKISLGMSEYDFNESSLKSNDSACKDDDRQQESNDSACKEDGQQESMDVEDVPAENMDSNLVSTEDMEEAGNVQDVVSANAKHQESSCKKVVHSKLAETVEKTNQGEKSLLASQSIDKMNDAASSTVGATIVNSKESHEKDLRDSLPPVQDSSLCRDNEELMDSEEIVVKPPKKTYIKRKDRKNVLETETNNKEEIELFSGDDFNFNKCDRDRNEVEDTDLTKELPTPPQDNSTESDDQLLLSGVQSKVSATYDRKRKPLLQKQNLRPRSLRPRRLSSNSPHKNGVSDPESKKDSNNVDNIPWGDVLLKTSFHPCEKNDVPSTSSQVPKEAATPILSPQQQRRKLNKYTRDFDRLLSSNTPSSTKRRRIQKGHKKVIRARAFSSGHLRPSDLGRHSSRVPKNAVEKRGHFVGRKPKEAKIEFLHRQPSQIHVEQPSQEKEELYSCSSCNFFSSYVDNLIEHLKYCSNRQPVLMYKVNDMEKRQRIRGEEEIAENINNTLEQIRSDIRNALMDKEYGASSQYGEEERDSDSLKKRKKYGYGEDDVVWVKFKDRFWPALVCDMKGMTAYVKLINYPKEVKGLKVKHENIRTFDNSKWNLLCLAEAETLPHNEIFVKAVQSCERFMSKKFLGVHITGKEFFSVRDEVDFATDSASSDSIVNEDSDSEDIDLSTTPARKARYEKLDVQKIHEHILQGKADNYVLDIYHQHRHSKKHSTFFEADNSDLRHKSWFGPCEDTKQQEDLFCHFRDLFLTKIGRKGFFVSYICQVWIPEAIVQAISEVQGIPLEDAEILFESEDSLDMEHEDPSIEEILKKYS